MVVKAACKTMVKLTPDFYLFVCKLLSERRIKLMNGLTLIDAEDVKIFYIKKGLKRSYSINYIVTF
jgi:hypothetical protein